MTDSKSDKEIPLKLKQQFETLKKNWHSPELGFMLSDFFQTCKESNFKELSSWNQRLHAKLELSQLKPFEIALERILADSIKGRAGYHQDEPKTTKQTCPLIVVAHNIRSAHNLGSMIRSCEHTGARGFILSGYTADIDLQKIEKTSMGSEHYIKIHRSADLQQTLKSYQDEGYQITAIETVKEAPSVYDYAFQAKTLMLFGNERMGLDQEMLDRSQVVRIPSYGQKNSLNVSVACGIGLNFYRKCFNGT